MKHGYCSGDGGALGMPQQKSEPKREAHAKAQVSEFGPGNFMLRVKGSIDFGGEA
jgi:hypothetical protein